MPILEVMGLAKSFGGLKAVDGVDFSIKERGLTAIIGPNGAGKTTLFNLISGVFKPTEGQILLKGEDVTDLPSYQRARRGLGRSFQITNIFPNLTVLENVRLSCQSIGRDSRRFYNHYLSFHKYLSKARELLNLFSLGDSAHLPAYILPHGDKRKLEIVVTLARDPEILLLDEPAAGISTEEMPGLTDLLQTIKEEGRRTILLVEHRMDVVTKISDSILVLNRGRILAKGDREEIMANREVQEAYLGGGTM